MLPLLLLSLSILTTVNGFPSITSDAGTGQSIIKDNLKISSAIRDILIDNEIIGDVLDDFEPRYAIDLAYPKYHEPVMLGNDIPVKSVAKRPTFAFIPLHKIQENRNTTLTLVMTDPDATSRDNPKKSEMCHWILTNLTMPMGAYSVQNLLAEKLKTGELESYYPPAPPEKTGKHRYVFVLLEGNGTKIKAPKERPHWGYGKVRHGVRDWAEENSLEVVGANFFFAQNKKQ